MRGFPLGLLAIATLVVANCDSDSVSPPDSDFISIGKWGADNNGAIVTDTGMHVHVGCTYGDVVGRVALDADGKFDVEGSYLLRAFPIAVGPTMPAQFVGTVRGSNLTLIVAVNDTIAHKLHVLGPVTVRYGREPTMGPCPICDVPGMRPLLR
jgi:hypothetical protein